MNIFGNFAVEVDLAHGEKRMSKANKNLQARILQTLIQQHVEVLTEPLLRAALLLNSESQFSVSDMIQISGLFRQMLTIAPKSWLVVPVVHLETSV